MRTDVTGANQPPATRGSEFPLSIGFCNGTLGFPGKGWSCVRPHWHWSITALFSSFLEVEKQGVFLILNNSFVFFFKDSTEFICCLKSHTV